jgi:hypothetical protein
MWLTTIVPLDRQGSLGLIRLDSAVAIRVKVYLRVTAAVMKHHDQRQLRKGLFGFHSLSYSPLKEAKAGTETKQKPGGRSGCRSLQGCRWLASHGLLSLLSYRNQDHHYPWPGPSPITH